MNSRGSSRPRSSLRGWWVAGCWLAVLALPLAGLPGARAADPVIVGSKRFTESYILGEIVRLTLQRAGVAAEHRVGLGNTAILEQALRSGAVDIYPEYTGTIERELLGRAAAPGDPPWPLGELNQRLAGRQLQVAVPLGFSNSYAIAMREAEATRLGVASLSDLARLPAPEALRLRPGLTHEFRARADGWALIQRQYRLAMRDPVGLDHGLAYQALAQGQVDLIDAYTTDAQLARFRLRVLQDDRGVLPRYDAVLLRRASFPPAAGAVLQALEGRLDARTMTALNAEVEVQGRSFTDVARGFLDAAARAPSGVEGQGAPVSAPPDAGAPSAPSAAPRPSLLDRIVEPDLSRLLLQHLALVSGSLLLAIGLGVPLGIAACRHPRLGAVVLAAVGLVQTIPSLALLAFLIAGLGTIGFLPALVALFLYALLPVVRNTHAGLEGVPAGLPQAARALGLGEAQVLRFVELPLALPTLLAGVSTAAVINVGTATVAAFVGAGGLGERIVAGLAVNDTDRMLAGAIPAAVLALVVQGFFALLRRFVVRAPATRAPREP